MSEGLRYFATTAALVVATTQLQAQHAVRRPIDGRPNAIVDLRTTEGARLVKAQWRYNDTTLVDHDKSYEYEPKAGEKDYDDSRWEEIDPTSLENRRSRGRLAFSWYRTAITIPEL